MLADFFTKPLQGSLFRKMRDVVMGLQPITILKTEDELMQNEVLCKSTSPAADVKPMLTNLAQVGSTPILKYNKERVAENNIPKKVIFSDDCDFKNKNSTRKYDRKYEGEWKKSISPTYLDVAKKQYVRSKNNIRKNGFIILSK